MKHAIMHHVYQACTIECVFLMCVAGETTTHLSLRSLMCVSANDVVGPTSGEVGAAMIKYTDFNVKITVRR